VHTNGVVQVNGANLSYETKGEGRRPLVLLHDGLLDRRVWDYQVEAFTQEFRVVRYDRRGYGGSAAPRKGFSDVEDLHCLLGHLGISKVWLMGASNGGRIATRID
jgi:pimeloyl-ACP methyl ester carboxylesterase